MLSIAQTHSNRPFQATMFRETEVNIGPYANLNMTNINEGNLDKRYALDALRSHCSIAAIVDANDRFDSPRCAEATRRDIIQKMEDWVHHDGHHSASSRIFWLYGGAGAGKSALAQTLAEKFKTNEALAASFFFFRTDVNRNDGNRLIPTIALQLVQSFQGLTPFVEEKILKNPDLFKKNRQTQMLELLVEPLTRLSLEETDRARSNPELKSHPRLVVIDGLDECNDQDTQCDLLRIIASTIPHLPYPLRFLITSRPESHITRLFQYDLGQVAQYDLSRDSNADKDIRNFLEGEFAKIHRTHPLQKNLPSQWPPRDSISSIVDRSSGHFIYASTVMRFIQSHQHRPDDRLQVILGLKQRYEMDRPYDRLDLLYSMIFLQIQDPGQLEKIHCGFGIIHLRSLKKGIFAQSQWASDHHAIEILLTLKPGDLPLLFDPLLSLVTFDKGNIRVLHKSLFDYLLDSSRSGDRELDLGLAHEAAANYVLKGKNLQGGWEPAEFSHFAYHCQFARLSDTLKDHIRSLANIAFEPLLRPLGLSNLLQSMLYFLQAIGRQDFDSSGDYHKRYIEKQNQFLRSAVPLGQRLNCMLLKFKHLEITDLQRRLRLSLEISFESLDLTDVQLRGTNGRTPIPAANRSVIKSVEREHEMLSSYFKAHHRYPNIVVSFLEATTGLIHSCHFVISIVTLVTFLTYTEYGVRVSCSKFEDYSLQDIQELVREHHQRIQNEASNIMTMVYSKRSHKPQNEGSTPNIIVLGEAGCGKSSIVNMIVGSAVAKVSNNLAGCTYQNDSYEASIGGTAFRIFDTVGLDQGDSGRVPSSRAVQGLSTLIQQLDGVSLLVFCIRGRVKATTGANWVLFNNEICGEMVPIIAVVTGLEGEANLNGWWGREENREVFIRYGMKPRGVSCVVSIRGTRNQYSDKYRESQEKLRDLIFSSYRRNRNG